MKAILGILIFMTTPAVAGIDDSELTGPRKPLMMSVSSDLAPSEVIKTPLKDNSLSISSFILKGEELIEVRHLTFESDEDCTRKSSGDPVQFNLEMESPHVVVRNQSIYEVEFEAQCGFHHELIFDSESPEGQAVRIWEVSQRAVLKFSQIDRLDFWEEPVTMKWPSNGDYYSWGTVNLTRGDHWDVVGHELGHAIYDIADIGTFGGGSHRIDECYTHALALSEGWASFFAAWVMLDLEDPNAQFEFMVPRRAPLGVEIVPEDVCEGPTNEWRVYSFLWDLIDLNDDGEVANLEFLNYWDSVFDKNVRDIQQHSDLLIQDGMDPSQVEHVWRHNFKTDM